LEEKLAETEQQLAEARAEIALLRREREVGVVVLPCAHGEDADRRDDGESELLRKDIAVEEVDLPVDESMDGVENMQQGDEMAVAQPPTQSPPTLTLNLTNIHPDAFLDSFYTLTNLPTPIPSSPDLALDLDIAGPPPCCEDKPATSLPPSSDPECSTCKTRPAPLPSESTTLCAQAYVMISQQNFRHVDAGTIRLWLYQGYRRAQRQGEGCRVENGALFRLLDFISGL
jgi:hypothetical protein